ncbi:MAG: serpin family protein [Bacteroidales bacterium]|nr:serpin family protein [Bacteroidales bacterium]
MRPFSLIACCMLFLLVSCGKQDVPPEPLPEEKTTTVPNQDTTQVTPGGETQDPAEVEEEDFLTKLNSKAFRTLYENRGKKYAAFSPAAVTCLYGMLSEGKTSVKNDFFSESDIAALEAFCSSQTEWMSSLDAEDAQLEIANGVALDKSLTGLDAFRAAVTEKYKADLLDVDFSKSEETRDRISAWVAEKTHGRQTAFSYYQNEPKAIFLNTLFFQADWTWPFDKANTTEGYFYPGEKITKRPIVEYMNLEDPDLSFDYYHTYSFSLLTLPLGKGSCSLSILLPSKHEDLYAWISTLNGKVWAEALAGRKKERVKITLPKLEGTGRCSWRLDTEELPVGMPIDPYYFHQANTFSMDEGGVHASAGSYRSLREKNPLQTRSAAAAFTTAFRATHPFVFVLHDSRTGLILMLGYYYGYEPTPQVID